jgi:hypothetical protein
VVGLGVVSWRCDRRLWFFLGLGLFATVLSIGVNSQYWVPWNVIAHVPLVRSIIPSRFFLVTTLSSAAALAVVVDRAHGLVAERGQRLFRSDQGRRRTTRIAKVAPAAVALVFAAVAVVPLAGAISDNVPITTRQVALPLWFAEAGPHLSGSQVVLTYPAPFTLVQSAMAWQAVDLLHFALVGGGGPEGLPARAGSEKPGFDVMSAMSFSLDGPPEPSTANVEALREAIAGWGVTIVVVPDQSRLPSYDRGTNPASALGLFTLAIGRSPQFHDDAWIWNGVQALSPRLVTTTEAFDRCTGVPLLGGESGRAVTSCVVAASHPAT